MQDHLLGRGQRTLRAANRLILTNPRGDGDGLAPHANPESGSSPKASAQHEGRRPVISAAHPFNGRAHRGLGFAGQLIAVRAELRTGPYKTLRRTFGWST